MNEEFEVNGNDQICEQLSALMDGELARDQVRFLLRGVGAQSDLAQRWSNYHVISATLRHEYLAVGLPASFADGVLGRLDGQRGAAGTNARGFAALRWVGGGAIAAAVAVVALVVSRPIGDNRASPGTTFGPVVAQQAPARHVGSPYLPVLPPAPPAAIANPLPMAGFNANDVLPASFDSPDYYSPRGTTLSRDDLSAIRVPYVLYLRPALRPSGVQAAPQQGAVSPQ